MNFGLEFFLVAFEKQVCRPTCPYLCLLFSWHIVELLVEIVAYIRTNYSELTPACIRHLACILDSACIRTLSTCHTMVINFFYIYIECAVLLLLLLLQYLDVWFILETRFLLGPSFF